MSFKGVHVVVPLKSVGEHQGESVLVLKVQLKLNQDGSNDLPVVQLQIQPAPQLQFFPERCKLLGKIKFPESTSNS